MGDIENYATHIVKAVKIVKTMETFGKVGIGLNALNAAGKIYDACTTGRECEKTTFTSVGEFGGGLGGATLAGMAIEKGAATAVCSLILGTATFEAAGIGALSCNLIVSLAGEYAAEKTGENIGVSAGELIIDIK